MHGVKTLTVTNYRSIKGATFRLSEYTPLVGFNNVGKTNILRALEWAVAKYSLSEEDFCDPTKPIVVEVEIEGITQPVLDGLGDTHKSKISPFVHNGRISLRRTQEVPGQSASKLTPELRQPADGEWKANPAGIEAAISALFPEPIFVGAMENAADDVGKFGTSTTIGKLLKEIVQPVNDRHADTVQAALHEVSKKLSADSPEKDPDLLALDTSIEAELSRFFPGVKAKTHIPTPSFSDFMKGATIKLFEEGYDVAGGRNAAAFGHGAQRSVQMALIKCLSDIKKNSGDNTSRTTLLLIDEPELYLHPQAVETVRASLKALAGEGYQVVFSTHSGMMIPRSDAANALVIRRKSALGTYPLPRIKDAVLAAIEDSPTQSDILFDLSNANRILFCETVVLAEGKTEGAVLPDLYAAVRNETLDAAKLALVPLGGANNVPAALKVLQTMGIPAKAIVDLDFAFRGAIKGGLLDANHQDILTCKSILKQLNSSGQIELEGDLPKGKNGGPTAAQAFELLATQGEATASIANLHSDLRDKGTWLWRNGAIEPHLGLSSKGAKEHADFIKKLEAADFVSGLPDAAGIAELCAWLCE